MNELDFINDIYNKIKSGRNIYILKPMNEDEDKKILEVLKNYNDIVTFYINENSHKQLVLRYRPNIEEMLDLSQVLKDASNYYKKGEYSKTIEKCLLLFKLKNIKPFVYNLLGLSYLKLNNKALAIDYLTITNYLFKEEKNNAIDYSELLLALKGEIEKNDKKIRFKMKLDEFYKDENYGIENIDEIIELLVKDDISIKKMGETYNITNEKINIIILLLAKRYFLQGDIKKGEEFIKSVEQSKDKTNLIINILNEIKNNKKIYINKNSTIEKKLSLSIKVK